jgi:hypothetical protein
MSGSFKSNDDDGENHHVFSAFLKPDCFRIPLLRTGRERSVPDPVLYPVSDDRVMVFLKTSGNDRKRSQVHPSGGLVLS